jgi:ArsR family transcriptional regulator, lead/cadmium/zinc/bismuth-responsive transcriptional repressor
MGEDQEPAVYMVIREVCDSTMTARKSDPSAAGPPQPLVEDPGALSLEVCAVDSHAPRTSPKARAISDATYERAAAIFRAAGDEARLRLLTRLADGEWCVSELAAAAEVGMSTVSQQLRLLRSERLIARRRAGKHIYYRLADAHIMALLRGALEHAEEPSHEETEETEDEP